MKNGWIKLYRGLLEHGIFQDAQVLQVWMYCLLRATYRETKVTVGRQVVVCSRDSFYMAAKQSASG